MRPTLPDRRTSFPATPGPATPGPADARGRPGEVPRPPAGRHLAPTATYRGPELARWLEERTRLSAAHVVVLGIIVLLGLILAAWSWQRAQPRDHPAIGAVLSSSTSVGPEATPLAGTPAGPPAEPASAPAKVVVDVAGQVRRPGVVTLPAGSRVIDALRRAGGVRRGTDTASVNLARVLQDGEQVLIGGPGPAPGPTAAAGSTGLVSLNRASQAELEQVPGIGPVTAGRILAWRAEHGGFSAVSELLEISGIGEKTLAELAAYLTL